MESSCSGDQVLKIEYLFESIRFRYYKVRPFNPSSRFTNVSPLLGEPFSVKVDGKDKEIGCYFPNLFNMKNVGKFNEQAKQVCRSAILERKKSEADLVIELIRKVMLPLFGKVTLEKNKTKYSGMKIGWFRHWTHWHGNVAWVARF